MTTKQIADYALMLSDQDAEIKVLKAEIAALREAVRWYHGYEVKGWPEFPVEMVVGKRYVFRSVARENSDTVRRALKEKP
ncbi:MAG TPA: hypothetical protein PLS95_01115 [Thermoanaerobaculales bacterium]|nr:hypothetical protein [Thermoanaerobaculales bacterium]